MPVYRVGLWFAATPGPWGTGLGWGETYDLQAQDEGNAWLMSNDLESMRLQTLMPAWQIIYRRVEQLGFPRDAVSQGVGIGGYRVGDYPAPTGARAAPPNWGILLRLQTPTGSRGMRVLRGVDDACFDPISLKYTPTDIFTTGLNNLAVYLKANGRLEQPQGQWAQIQNVIPWRAGSRKVGRPFGTVRKRTRIR